MAALACIPLGLAVRDYVKGGSPPAPEADDPYEDVDDTHIDVDELEQDTAREQREHERAEERKAQRAEGLDRLLGSEPATLGSAFRGLQLGMPESMFDNHYDESSAVHRLARAHDLMLDLHTSDGVFDAVSISPYGDEDEICEQLHAYLIDHWKADGGARTIGDALVWQSPAGVRAELTPEETCTLTFREFVPADAWIKKAGSPFPLWAVGQSSSNLVKSIEPQRANLSNAPASISWTTVGVGYGVGAPELEAWLRHGKVVAITATLRGDPDTAASLAESLDKLLGKRTQGGDDALIWTKPPTAHLEVGAENTYTLTVGTIPEE